jgi:DNA-binding MarR family transcriptional regulator
VDEIRKSVRRIYRTSNLFIEKSLEGVALTPTELTAIRSIVFHKGLTQTSLAEHLGSIDKAAVARIVKSLEDKGYITRIPDPQDKRAKLVYPLEKAFQLRLTVLGAENDFYRWILSDLSEKELTVFSEFMSRLGEKAINESKTGFGNIKEG